MRAKDVLLDAVRSFTGTVIFVSHDRYFIDGLATRVFEVEDKRVHIYPGNYEDYMFRKSGGLPQSTAEAAARSKIDAATGAHIDAATGMLKPVKQVGTKTDAVAEPAATPQTVTESVSSIEIASDDWATRSRTPRMRFRARSHRSPPRPGLPRRRSIPSSASIWRRASTISKPSSATLKSAFSPPSSSRPYLPPPRPPALSQLSLAIYATAARPPPKSGKSSLWSWKSR